MRNIVNNVNSTNTSVELKLSNTSSNIVNNVNSTNTSVELKLPNTSSNIYDECLGSKPIIKIYPLSSYIFYINEEIIIDASETVDSDNSSVGLTYNWDIFSNIRNDLAINNQNKLILPANFYTNDNNLKIIFTAISSKIPYLTSTSVINIDVIKRYSITAPSTWSKSSDPSGVYRAFVNGAPQIYMFSWDMYDSNGNSIPEVYNPNYRLSKLNSTTLILSNTLVINNVLQVGMEYKLRFTITNKSAEFKHFWSNILITP